MKLIKDHLQEKEMQLAVLHAEIALLRKLLAEANGEPEQAAPRRKAPRANVKQIVLELLELSGDLGLNAAIAVEMAKERGQDIERASVSSILSRLKGDRVATYDGERYRLAKPALGAPPNVHPHPASKGVFG